MVRPLRSPRLLIIIGLLVGLTRQAIASDFVATWFYRADRATALPTSAAAAGTWASACFWIFGCGNRGGAETRPATTASAQKNAAADRVEKLYNGVAVGTDAAGHQGYNAAQKAEKQLRLDFASSFQNPQKNAANQTAWDQEEAQLMSDSLKYAGDRSLDAAAMYWGATRLNLPVLSPQEIIAQANAMPVSDQPGDRQFDEYMANYLAVRFDALNRLAGQYQTATNDIEGNHVPLDLPDLQAALRLDEVDRTFGKSKPVQQ